MNDAGEIDVISLGCPQKTSMKNGDGRGFTLLEMAVVLAIIAVMAAIMTPIVTNYIDQARTARAAADVQSIGQAMTLHYRDTGKFPVWLTTTAASTGTTPDKDVLVSGTNAAIWTAPTGSTHATGWTTATVGLLNTFLNTNSLGYSTSPSTASQLAYRGPYLDGLSGTDPWGDAYVVTSKYLATAGANSTNWAFVISAGPNQTLDSTFAQPRTALLSTASDDITFLIR